MAKSVKNTASAVRKLLEDDINGLGYDIWDVEYVKEGPDYHLKITIDSADGIYIEDCEKVHRFIDPILDEADPIEESYILEVSSPGIERDIRTPEHYEACVGETVILKLFTAIDGAKQIIGTLSAYDIESDVITIKGSDGKDCVLPRSAVSKANIYYDFGD